jgi:hypothetical protein
MPNNKPFKSYNSLLAEVGSLRGHLESSELALAKENTSRLQASLDAEVRFLPGLYARLSPLPVFKNPKA